MKNVAIEEIFYARFFIAAVDTQGRREFARSKPKDGLKKEKALKVSALRVGA